VLAVLFTRRATDNSGYAHFDTRGTAMTGLEAGRVGAPSFRSDVAEQPLVDEAVGALRWIALLAVIMAVTALAVWVVSPRFAIDGPSLVDDWSAISRSGDQLKEFARLRNPEEQRFRPGWIAWNYAQWHTFDAPGGLVGPNVWGVVRLLVLVSGLTLLTLLALPVARSRREAVLQAALAGIPALVVVTAPKLVFDLARFGPQEPLLVGAMTLGGSLLVLAAQQLLDAKRPVRRAGVATLLLTGSLLWILGVYQKEVSLAALPLLAAVAVAGRERLRSWSVLSGARKRLLVVVALVVLLPLAHVGIESALITLRGDLVYDAKVDRGRGLVDGFDGLFRWTHAALPPHWELFFALALALTVVAAVRGRKVDAVAVGVLSSSVLALVLAGQSGVVVSRYYIPVLAVGAVVLPLALARFSPVVQVVGLLAVLVALTPVAQAHRNVGRWVDDEIVRDRIVREVAEARSSGCIMAAAGLDEETAQALPILVEMRAPAERGACGDGDVLLLAGPRDEGDTLLRACSPGTLEPVLDGVVATLYSCGQLRDGASARALVEQHRL
jgi:hypothetical protein